jgi:hypothetical protein
MMVKPEGDSAIISEELKPCPFCGDDAVKQLINCNQYLGVKITCNNSDCDILPSTATWHTNDEQVCIDIWNKRP